MRSKDKQSLNSVAITKLHALSSCISTNDMMEMMIHPKELNVARPSEIKYIYANILHIN